MSDFVLENKKNIAEFKLYSPHAEAVELCLFSENFELQNVVSMRKDLDGHWHKSVDNHDFIYAYRLYGEWNPRAGRWFNPNKFMFDPYAKHVGRVPTWGNSLFSYQNRDLDISIETNINNAALSAYRNSSFDWKDDKPPNTSWKDTVIYETHLKGLTKLHPEISIEKQGTYLGLADEALITHLKKIGVTAIELLPIQAFFTEYSVQKNGLKNYWGYNPYSWFAPEPSYCSKNGMESSELKSAIKALHAAGIEVILDIVFNHTAEGDFWGPALSLRGIENSYYLFDGDYLNYTGCGNTLDFSKRFVRDLAMSSLEHWVTEYHIDGFRFDLASSLQRNKSEIKYEDSFFYEISQNPILKNIKIIAEPWDLGPNGYQFGNFHKAAPLKISEWNDKYRDTVRKYWAGWEGSRAEFATRIAGSNDVFENPCQSINFITAHDGFTLKDLVSYSKKNNLVNLENNNDGSDNNFSLNFGAEGETNNQDIIRDREKQIRNYLFTLFFSVGVPMLVAGDEIGKTQNGNNNAYCQDNELSWLDWNLKYDFREYVSDLIKLRKELDLFANYFDRNSLIWLNEKGEEIKDWNIPYLKAMCALFKGKVLFAYNASEKDLDFVIEFDSLLKIDTSKKPQILNQKVIKGTYLLATRSAALFVKA